jgi:uncharacterized protein HemY
VLHAASQRALVLGDTARTIAWLDRAVTVAPSDRLVRTMRVNLALARRDTVRARGLLTDGLAIEPDQKLWRRQLDGLK